MTKVITPTRDEARRLISSAIGDLRGAFLLAGQEGFTKSQMARWTGLSPDTVRDLARDWLVQLK